MTYQKWTGNAHLICDACGRHSRLGMKTFGDRLLCPACMEALMALIREKKKEA